MDMLDNYAKKSNMGSKDMLDVYDSGFKYTNGTQSGSTTTQSGGNAGALAQVGGQVVGQLGSALIQKGTDKYKIQAEKDIQNRANELNTQLGIYGADIQKTIAEKQLLAQTTLGGLQSQLSAQIEAQKLALADPRKKMILYIIGAGVGLIGLVALVYAFKRK
jgi:hypothetical protein